MTVNVLSMQERVRVVSALVEGTSLRATERLTGVFRQAITGLLLCVGEGCRWLLDATMRDLHCDVLELDEVWAFVGKKEGHLTPDDPEEYGDQYTWIALDARTKLVPVHRVEKRTPAAANAFARELRGRVLGAPQITTDGHKPYLAAVEAAFGKKVHYAQILKTYRADESSGASRDDVRYSRGRVVRSVKRVVTGKPIHLGGSLGRVKATGRGVFVTGREAARRIGLNLEGARVAVQGFGNVDRKSVV